MDRFIKDMESVMRRSVREDAPADAETQEGSSSDMDFGNIWTWIYHEVFYLLNKSLSLEYMDLIIII